MLGTKLGIVDKQYNIVTDGLTYNIEPSFKKCYPGTGTNIYNLASGSLTPTGSLINNGTNLDFTPPSGNNGGYLSFDGTDDLIEVNGDNPAINLTSQFTIDAWCNPDSWGTWTGIVYKVGTYGSARNQSYYLGYNISVGIIAGVRDSLWHNQNSYTSLTIGDWSNVGMIYDYPNTTLKIYKNGVVVYTNTSYNRAITGNTDPMTIGYGNGTSEDFDGKIGNVKIYNRVLSDAEFLQNYNATKDRYT